MESKDNNNFYTIHDCPNWHGSLNSFFTNQGLHPAVFRKAPPIQFTLPVPCFQTFALMYCLFSLHSLLGLDTVELLCYLSSSLPRTENLILFFPHSQLPASLIHSLTWVNPGTPAGPELWEFRHFCWGVRESSQWTQCNKMRFRKRQEYKSIPWGH